MNEAIYIKRIRCQIDNTPVITIAIKKTETGYAIGTCVCAFDDTPDNKEGVRRATRRAVAAEQLGAAAGECYVSDLFYMFSEADRMFLRTVVGATVKVRQSGEDEGTVKGIKFNKLNVTPDVPQFVWEIIARKQAILDGKNKEEKKEIV